MPTLQDQIDFLRTAASDGVEEAFKGHGDAATYGEAQGLTSLSDTELQSLYAINKAIADKRVGNGGDANAMPNNIVC